MASAAVPGQEDPRQEWGHIYQEGIAECEAMPPGKYHVSLFNPPGLRTAYTRSRCFQRAAVEWRDADLCEQVRQRRILWWFDGYATSEQACRAAVAERLTQDQERAEAIDVSEIHRMKDARFERSANGRDIDVHLRTVGSLSTSYRLLIEVDDGGGGRSVLGDYVQPLGPSNATLLRSIPGQAVLDAFPGLRVDRDAVVHISLELRAGSPDRLFVLSRIPRDARRSSFSMRVDFVSLGLGGT